MTAEQLDVLNTWWQEQAFNGKEQFNLDAGGNIVLLAHDNVPDRIIAAVTPEDKDTVLKNLQEKYDAVVARVTETEVEWLAAEDKIKMAEKVEHLKDHLLQAVAVGDMQKPMQIVAGWEQALKELTEEHYQARLKITEAAEALAESEEWKETGIKFKDLVDQWKHAGYVDKRRSDKLWNRIEAARTKFMDRKRVHQDNEEKNLLDALDLKIELAEQAEKLANSESWKSTTEAFQSIVEKWKTIGRTLPKKNEELWQRIMTARSTFLDRKKAHYEMVKQEHETNYAVKLALVEKAEALRDSKEWGTTAQAYNQLMEEWKKSGRTMQEKGEELWKRFITAKEAFFDAKHQHSREIRSSQESNLELKQQLLHKAEQLKNSSRWGEVAQEMNRLLEEWKKIGPVPKEHSNTIWESFIAARKHFFARKDENKVYRREQAIAHRSQIVEQAHSLVRKVRDEIVNEEEKILDFNNALENITPGKKAEELRAHLEVLIGDSNARLKRLKEKLAAAEDELRSIAEKENKASKADNAE